MFFHGLHCVLFFFGLYASKVVCAYACFYFFRRIHLKHFGQIFESCRMVDSLSDLSGIVLVCTDYFHSAVTFFIFPLLGSHGSTLLLYPLLFPQSSFFLVQLLNFCLVENFNRFFAGCTCWSYSGYAPTIGTLIGSALTNGFDWYEFFIWVYYWFTC